MPDKDRAPSLCGPAYGKPAAPPGLRSPLKAPLTKRTVTQTTARTSHARGLCVRHPARLQGSNGAFAAPWASPHPALAVCQFPACAQQAITGTRTTNRHGPTFAGRRSRAPMILRRSNGGPSSPPNKLLISIQFVSFIDRELFGGYLDFDTRRIDLIIKMTFAA